MKRVLAIVAVVLAACGLDSSTGTSLCNDSRYQVVTVGGLTKCIDTQTGTAAEAIRCTCNEEISLTAALR